MDVRRKETNSGQDTGVKRSLMKDQFCKCDTRMPGSYAKRLLKGVSIHPTFNASSLTRCPPKHIPVASMT